MAESAEIALLRRRARRRLIGAIALALFIVVVFPVILEREPKSVPQDLTVDIPSQDAAGRFAPRIAPPAAPAAKPTAPAPGASTPSAPPAAATAAQAPKEGASREGTASTPANAEEKRVQALLEGQSWIVPLGTFANADNARRVRDKAAASGIRSYVEKIKGAKGDESRVRAGPFESREAAERAREKLQAAGLSVGKVAQQ